MLKLKNISVSFDKKNVLKNLSATLQHGDFVTIVGSNGAGKSTLFDLIAGRIKPEVGRIELDGQDITGLDERARSVSIARLFQNTHLSSVPSLTVSENLALATAKGRSTGLGNIMKSFPEHIVELVLKPMGMDVEALLDRPMGLLSGGQRQIISLVMATLVPPKLLLLDEPTAALDPVAATKLLVFAAELIKKHKITTLLITHDQRIATHLGNKLWILENGTISKTFGEEKKSISTSLLAGDVDYEKLLAVSL